MVSFPLLLIPLAIYNIIVFLMPGVSFVDPLLKLHLMSGTEWQVTLSDVLLTVGILMLLLEVMKGARPGAKYLTDHLLSFVLFGAAAAEFVLWPKFGTSTYFLLMLLAMVDFFSGVALRVRRRAVAHPQPVSSRSRARAEPLEPDPSVQVSLPESKPESKPATPAPASQAPATQSAASVAESVLLDREPRAIQSTPSPGESSKAESSKAESSKAESSKAESSKAESSKAESSSELQPGSTSKSSSEY